MNSIKSGQLYHSSETRECFINGHKPKYIDSGDNIEIYMNQIYLTGRNNRIIKINSKLTDLNLLEMVIL